MNERQLNVSESAYPALDEDVEHSVYLLPELGDEIRAGAYTAPAISLMKELRSAGMDVGFLTPPVRLLEQRSADWFGPALLFISAAYNTDPTIFAKVLEVIGSHVKSLYPEKTQPEVRFSVNIQKTNSKKVVEVSYEGSTEGFDALAQKLQQICEDN